MITESEATTLVKANFDKYYVYIVYLNQKPIYVGKGIKYRFKSHWRKKAEVQKTNKRWYNVLKRYRSNFTYKIHFCKSEDKAFALEKRLIRILGRYKIDKNGCLMNVAIGGDGGRTIDLTPYEAEYTQILQKFNCSLVGPYRGVQTKTLVKCEIHSQIFETMPFDTKARSVSPCLQCRRAVGNSTSKLTEEEFISRLSNQFNTSHYSFSTVEYVNSRTPVEILCLEHGSFWKRPKDIKKAQKELCKKCADKYRYKERI